LKFFPGLQSELLRVGGAILGTISGMLPEEAGHIMKKLPQVDFRSSNRRRVEIYRVYHWLADKDTVDDVVRNLKSLCGGTRASRDHPLIKCVDAIVKEKTVTSLKKS